MCGAASQFYKYWMQHFFWHTLTFWLIKGFVLNFEIDFVFGYVYLLSNTLINKYTYLKMKTYIDIIIYE